MTPEQQADLQKKLENMSPEELREFQKKQCIFCHIVSGKVAAKKVYEDDKAIAVLDINPANPGHILLMPKEHYMIMPQMPEEELKHIFILAKHLSNVLLKALDVRGTNIIVANGPAAGQKAQHFMIHIIPRKEEDGVEFKLPSTKREDEELEEIAKKVRKRLNELLGVKNGEQEVSAEDLLKNPTKKIVEAEYEENEDENKEDEDYEEENESKEEEPEDGEEDKEPLSKSDDEGLENNKERRNDDKGESEKHREEDQESSEEVDLDSIARVLNG